MRPAKYLHQVQLNTLPKVLYNTYPLAHQRPFSLFLPPRYKNHRQLTHKHCEYQSFVYTHEYGAAQVVHPVKPIPPH